MTKSLRLEKDVRNLFRLKQEMHSTTINDVRNLFRLKKEIDGNTVKDTRNLFRLKKENLKKSDMWKIQLTIAINFFSKDND